MDIEDFMELKRMITDYYPHIDCRWHKIDGERQLLLWIPFWLCGEVLPILTSYSTDIADGGTKILIANDQLIINLNDILEDDIEVASNLARNEEEVEQ